MNAVTAAFANKPDFRKYKFTIHLEGEGGAQFKLYLRIPDWIMDEAKAYINGELIAKTEHTDEFLSLEREWKDGDRVELTLPVGLQFIPLPDDPQMGAFRYGADVLAGITEQERVLNTESPDPMEELSPDTEREWGTFRTFYRTENQDPGISFRKLNEIGYEPYQIYFRVREKKDREKS